MLQGGLLPQRHAWIAALALLLVAAVLLAGCTGSRPVQKAGPADRARGVPTIKIGQPYAVDGVWYYPRAQPSYDESGVASWYGARFHGRLTANGETYDMNELTAAHPTLPLPSFVRVTNLDNGRSLVLRVNDRGPFVNGRIIDVSRRAAQMLGFHDLGTAKVRVVLVNENGDPPGEVMPEPVLAASERGAMPALPTPAVASQPLPPPPGIPAAAPREPAGATVAKRAPADAPRPGMAPARRALPARVETRSVQETAIFVQAGAFVEYRSAQRLQLQLDRVGPSRITPVEVDGQRLYRVRIGPLASVTEADVTLQKVLDRGVGNARIVVD